MLQCPFKSRAIIGGAVFSSLSITTISTLSQVTMYLAKRHMHMKGVILCNDNSPIILPNVFVLYSSEQDVNKLAQLRRCARV